MTDARFPERWLNDRRFVRLSDRAFRGYVNALAWSVANRTDGHLGTDDLDLIRSTDTKVADELVAAALWSPTDGGWVIGEYEDTQTTRRELEVLDNLRRRDREKKRRRRDRVPGTTVPGTVPGTGKAMTGQDRQETGQAPAGRTDAAGSANDDHDDDRDRVHHRPSQVSVCRLCGSDGGKPGIGGVRGLCVTCETTTYATSPTRPDPGHALRNGVTSGWADVEVATPGAPDRDPSRERRTTA